MTETKRKAWDNSWRIIFIWTSSPKGRACLEIVFLWMRSFILHGLRFKRKCVRWTIKFVRSRLILEGTLFFNQMHCRCSAGHGLWSEEQLKSNKARTHVGIVSSSIFSSNALLIIPVWPTNWIIKISWVLTAPACLINLLVEYFRVTHPLWLLSIHCCSPKSKFLFR